MSSTALRNLGLMAARSTSTVDPARLFDLTDKTAVVTGASSGLGARFSRVLAASGASVVLAARREAALASLAADLPRASVHAVDLQDPSAIAALVEATVERHGTIDILVNNAGVVDTDSALDLTVESFRDVVEVNLTAPFLLARAAAPHMPDGGSVINIVSINATLASRDWPQTAYAASKGGLLTLTRELANQWASRGIRVNAIAPGYFETEMTADLFASPGGARWIEQRTPLGRAGRAGELDGAILYLASAASSYMTGQMLTVDGGWSIV